MDFYIFNNGLVVEKGMSGSDQRVYQWSQIFKKKGHKITLFIPKVGFKRFQKFGFKLIITSHIRAEKWGYFLTYLWQAYQGCLAVLRLKITSRKIIVYSSSDLIADSLPALLMKFKNKSAKLVCGLHLLAPLPWRGFTHVWQKGFTYPSPKSFYYFFTQRIVIFFLKRLANLVLVSNSGDRKFLLKKGFLPNQVLVTYGGVDFRLISKEKFSIKYQAAWIGRLHAQKGIDDLFKAWVLVVKKMPKAKMAIIGESDLRGYFHNQPYSRLLKKNVVFTGYLDGKDLFDVLKSSQLFLCPSYYESFGIVMAEAMAVGLPVVAYDLPIYKEIYPQGLIKVPISNFKQLGIKTMELLVNDQKRKKIAKEAIFTGKNFNWEKTANTILKYL
jgi:glycosyltransferase involved in cell wall biosynthesis